MRIRVWGVVVVSVVVAALGACGSDEATPLEAVQRASSETIGEKTAKLHMEIKSSAAAKPIVYEGAFDFSKSLAEFTIDAAQMGIPGASGSIDAVMDFSGGGVQYMKLPGLEDEVGKQWMKIDLGSAIKEACPEDDFSSLFAAQSGNPTSGLQVLRGATAVKEVGEEKLRGAKTTHFTATIDLVKAAEEAPEAQRDALRKFASFAKVKTQDVDVWLDDDDRVRKMVQTTDLANYELPACLTNAEAGAANPFTGTTTTSYEVYDFGAKVDIEIPAANDVADLSDLIGDATEEFEEVGEAIG